MQHAKIFGRKMLEAVAPTPEVIQKNNVLNVQLLDEVAGLHDQRKICRPHPAVDDRSGNAKPGGGNGFASEAAGRLAREFLDDELEVRELLAGEALLEDGREGPTFFREERQITLRPANISCQDHRFPPCPASDFFSTSGIATTGCTTVCRRVRAEDRILLGPNSLPDIAARGCAWRGAGRFEGRRGRRPSASCRSIICRRQRFRFWKLN